MADVQLYRDPQTGTYYKRDGDQFVRTDPTAAETGPIEAALVGAGSTFAGAARGAQMRLGQLTGDQGAYSRAFLDQSASDESLAGLRAERPVSSFVGGALPFLAVPAGGAGLAASAGVGAGLGLLDPSADPSMAAGLGAGGGAAGWSLAAAARAARASSQGGSMADRVQARIRAAGAPDGPPAGRFEPPAASLDDLASDAQRQGVADAVAVRAGVDPKTATAARIQELGYDPALLGGRARTVDPGEVHKWAVDVLKREGFKLTPGEEFNIKGAKRLEASAESNFATSAPIDALRSINQGKFNGVVARAIGQDGEQVTLQTINNAHEFVGETFRKQAEAIRARGGVPAGGLEAVIQDISARFKEYKIDLPDEWLARYKRSDSTFDPAGLLEARQRLNSIARSDYAQGMTTRMEGINDMIEAIDDAFSAAARSQGGEPVERAREIYRVLRVLDRPGVWKETGDVAMGPMYRALKSGFRNEMKLRTETSAPVASLINVIRAREAAIPSFIGDSGTATRMSFQSLLNNPVRTIAEQSLGRGLAMAYLGVGRVAGGRAAGMTPQGVEQLSGIWGNTW